MRRGLVSCGAVLGVSLLLGACSAEASRSDATQPGTADTGAIDVAVIVSRAASGASLLPDPAARHPSGSRVLRTEADGSETVLSGALDAAGAAAVHPDGTRVLFVGRRSGGEPFAVFECAADGSDLRRVVSHASDCVRADYLPDGRIVYAALVDAPSPLEGVARGAALFVTGAEGEPGAQVTFGAGLDTDPAVLSDGRVVFASWRPGAKALGLFTVHPDGTGYAPFHLPDGHAVLPRQRADGDVEFDVIGEHGITALAASWDAPMSIATETARSGGVPLRVRQRPQGHLSSMRAERPYGTLVCVDARRRGATHADRVRLRAYGLSGSLGTVRLEADGSFMARVPPDTPLTIELLDPSGAVVAAEQGPFWVRSNEVRVCATCHDDIETGPPNVRPLAVLRDPADLTGGDQ